MAIELVDRINGLLIDEADVPTRKALRDAVNWISSMATQIEDLEREIANILAYAEKKYQALRTCRETNCSTDARLAEAERRAAERGKIIVEREHALTMSQDMNRVYADDETKRRAERGELRAKLDRVRELVTADEGGGLIARRIRDLVVEEKSE